MERVDPDGAVHRCGAEAGALVDERLTSQEAESTIAKSRRRDIRASGIVDSRAATLILQDFLNLRFPPEMPSAPDDEDGR